MAEDGGERRGRKQGTHLRKVNDNLTQIADSKTQESQQSEQS